jgi:hypothetical protein
MRYEFKNNKNVVFIVDKDEYIWGVVESIPKNKKVICLCSSELMADALVSSLKQYCPEVSDCFCVERIHE